MPDPLSRRRFLHTAGRAALATGALGFRRPSRPGAPPPGTGPAPRSATYGYHDLGGPRGLRLSLVEDPASSRTITWLTSGAADPGSTVRFGVVPSHAPPGLRDNPRVLDRAVTGSSEPAPYGWGDPDDDAYGQPQPGELPVRVHRATLKDLHEGQTIAYQVGGGDQWSTVRSFRVGGSSAHGFTLTHVGDHGTTVASRRTTAAIAARSPDVHLMAGDISYANGDQPTWDRWADEIEPLGAAVPIMAAPGNHEAKDFNGETYRRRFSHPNHGRAWYSLDIGNVHLVSTTAGAFLREDDPDAARQLVLEELTWLEQDLAAAAVRRAAGRIDFLAVTQHFPLYTDHRTRGPVSPGHVAAQEQILQRYQVDLVLVGHDHMYQRSKPMAFGQPTGASGGDGPGYVQIVAGAGGKSLYEFTPIDTTEPGIDPANPWQRWSRWSDAWAREFHVVEYEVDGPTIRGRTLGWLDVAGQNDVPHDPATYEQDLVRVDPDGVDPDLGPRQVDAFTIHRKPDGVVTRAALHSPRAPTEILDGVPEARGIVVRNPAEDCTRHP